MIFLRVKISFVVQRIATDVYWVLGNTRFISRVEQDISLVRCAHS